MIARLTRPARLARPARLTRAIGVLALLVGSAALASACSLPPEDRVTQINADELGPELVNTTTTTTTTVPTTTAPPTTDPSSDQSTTTTTTMFEAPAARQRLYYTVGSSDVIGRINIPLPENSGYNAMLVELETPRAEVRTLGLSTAVRPGLIQGFTFDQTTVTLSVALDAATFETITESQRRRAIAQIVLTFTSFAPPDTGAIGFVNFTIDDEPISVFVPLAGGSSDDGEPLRFADFQPWLDDSPVTDAQPTTTTTTSTTTSTTNVPGDPTATSSPPPTSAG